VRLVHPATSLVLLALLLADAWFLPVTVGERASSAAGSFVRSVIAREPGHAVLFARPQMYVVRGDNGSLSVIDPEVDSMDGATRALAERPRRTLLLTYEPLSWSRGFWAPMHRTEKHLVKMSFGEDLTSAERAAARKMFVERSGAADFLSLADLRTLVERDIDESRVIWTGWLHNAGAIAALGLFLLSLRWVPRVPGWIRAKVGSERLSRGVCPRCQYALAGLTGDRCPECGAVIPARRQDRAATGQERAGKLG
jgi:hypothetical protein